MGAPAVSVAMSADHLRDPPGEPFADELALARAVAGGDRRAAERFARRLAPTVRRVARLLLRGAGDADDAAQTCLIELLRAAGGYEARGSLEGWAHRIAVRVVLRAARRSRDLQAREELRDDLHDAGPPTEPERPFDDLPRPLEHYLDGLADAHRSVLVLRHALGHTVPEIAEISGAPVPTVKSRLLKAQAELRRLIQRDIHLGGRQDRRPS